MSSCRYFLHGVCREGSHCQFSHDPSSSKPSTICKFYQRGTCAYGDRCRYNLHPRLHGNIPADHSAFVCVCVHAGMTMSSFHPEGQHPLTRQVWAEPGTVPQWEVGGGRLSTRKEVTVLWLLQVFCWPTPTPPPLLPPQTCSELRPRAWGQTPWQRPPRRTWTPSGRG